MLNTFQSAVSKALRVSGQSLDAFGRTFEVFPYIEKREYTTIPHRRPQHEKNNLTLYLLTLCSHFSLNRHAVQPSTRAVKFGKNIPVINGSFVSSTATVIGKVQIGSSSSVWYGAVVRGTNLPSYACLFIALPHYECFGRLAIRALHIR